MRRSRPRAKFDERWQETRILLHARANGECERCGKPAPLSGGLGIAGEGAHKERRWKGDKYNLGRQGLRKE